MGDGCVNKYKAFTGLTRDEYVLLHARQYNQQHKEIIADNKKHYYKKNKEIILENQKKKIQCDCGAIISKHSKAKHERSFIHLEYLKMLA